VGSDRGLIHRFSPGPKWCYFLPWNLTRFPGRGEPYPDSDKTATEEVNVMAWIVLVMSGVLEAVWATALGRSEGFTRLTPSIVFGVALVASMGGLAYAMRTLPLGTAYAVWVGIGASLTVAYSMATGGEAVSLLKIALILGLIGCVVGLKLAH
jgi:quaternary ammonium compound-resistance protein SugE